MEGNLKSCPLCYSEIDARATVCRYCRRDIAKKKATTAGKGVSNKTVFIVIGSIIFLLSCIGILVIWQQLSGPGPADQFVSSAPSDSSGSVQLSEYEHCDIMTI